MQQCVAAALGSSVDVAPTLRAPAPPRRLAPPTLFPCSQLSALSPSVSFGRSVCACPQPDPVPFPRALPCCRCPCCRLALAAPATVLLSLPALLPRTPSTHTALMPAPHVLTALPSQPLSCDAAHMQSVMQGRQMRAGAASGWLLRSRRGTHAPCILCCTLRTVPPLFRLQRSVGCRQLHLCAALVAVVAPQQAAIFSSSYV